MFKGFYNPSEAALNEAWKSEETIFVFDTNVFLNLYGYAEQTRDDFFELLEALDSKVWIPYQVGLEYQKRRLEIIRDEKAIFTKINDNLDKIEKVFKGDFEQLALKRRFPKLHENTEKLQKEIHKNITPYKKSVSYWDDKQPCVRSHDFIREKLNELTNEKIGEKPTDQDWLDNLYKEGEERYKNKVPPGFKDVTKSKADDRYFFYDGLKYDRQYGDLILWKQLIEKSSADEFKNVIFITDDSKEDWWYILESRGKKQIGPHANLQSEIYRESNLDIFHMYNTSSFLENGKKILDVGVHESSIKDANTQFLRSISMSSKNLEKRIIDKEREREIFKKSISRWSDYEKTKDFLTYFDKEEETDEFDKLKSKLKKRDELIKYITWKDLKSSKFIRNSDEDIEEEDDENSHE